jgi:hypothetical protein
VNDQPTFWFPAKRYGWGWGLPVRWQGWLVFVGYLALVYAGISYLIPRQAALSFFLYVAVLTAVLILIVALKGERPLRWRWGRQR